MPEKVMTKKDGDVASITLNRPDHGNAVDPEMMAQLIESLAEVVADDGLRLVVLQGNGRHFCSGREPGLAKPRSAVEWGQVLGQIVRVNGLLQAVPAVTLAVVRGNALGFGCGLAVQSDVTLAASDSRFGFPEIHSGFPPTIVMSYLSRWMNRKQAFELVITGDELGAGEAERRGLVNRVVPGDQLDREKDTWIEKLRSYDPRGLAATKAFFLETAEWHTQDALRYGVTRLANFLSSR